MARVLKGLHSFTCTPTRSSAIGMSHTYLPLPPQPQLVLIYRPRRYGRLSRLWCEVARAEIRTCNLPIANPALYHTTTSAPVSWLKLASGYLPRRSVPLGILSCPVTIDRPQLFTVVEILSNSFASLASSAAQPQQMRVVMMRIREQGMRCFEWPSAMVMYVTVCVVRRTPVSRSSFRRRRKWYSTIIDTSRFSTTTRNGWSWNSTNTSVSSTDSKFYASSPNTRSSSRYEKPK